MTSLKKTWYRLFHRRHRKDKEASTTDSLDEPTSFLIKAIRNSEKELMTKPKASRDLIPLMDLPGITGIPMSTWYHWYYRNRLKVTKNEDGRLIARITDINRVLASKGLGKMRSGGASGTPSKP